MSKGYFGVHNHTMYSNIRLLDSTNRPKDLINKAIELGLSGIAITDHECLSAHMEVNKYAKEIQKTYPEFKIALGNEIYLIDQLEPSKNYYHFILIAKDAIGYKALKELSSKAWEQSFYDRGMERVPTTKEDLTRIVNKYPGHLIATSACLGGELSSNALAMSLAERINSKDTATIFYNKIIDFVKFCLDLFGDDFYIECAPSLSEDQRIVNAKLLKIAKAFNIKMVVGTDSHYLTKNERYVHKAYLTSKPGDREVDSFYEFTYLMDFDECADILSKSFNNQRSIAENIITNTLEIQNKIKNYSLERKQIIPKVNVDDYPKLNLVEYKSYPTIYQLLNSDNIQERYWINECLKSLKDKDLIDKREYIQRIEIEADIIKYIGNNLEDCLFAYFNTFKHYIDLFWECGSIVGPGRGSATGFLSNYLLGITQLDPIRWNLPYWRLTLINY